MEGKLELSVTKVRDVIELLMHGFLFCLENVLTLQTKTGHSTLNAVY